MTIDEAIAARSLPRAETEWIIAHVLGKGRTWVLAHGEERLTDEDHRAIRQCMERRHSGEPLAYIVGEREFYGRVFSVTPAVLIPRPSTEGLVEVALEFLRHPQELLREVDSHIAAVARPLRPMNDVRTVVDIGTGSGCIAVTLALERPDLRVIATDINEEALSVARGNARLHGVGERMEFLSGKHLEPVRELLDPFLIVSNPPYIPSISRLPREVRDFEPSLALFGGTDGGDILRQIVSEARSHSCCVGMLLECQTDQISIIGLNKPK